MGRKSIIINSEDLKNGVLVWVLYRKEPWPVMIKRVYPKKITYNFLPITNHPNVFSTDLKNVKIFKISDKLPCNATEDQREAYELAMQILKQKDCHENNLLNYTLNNERLTFDNEQFCLNSKKDKKSIENKNDNKNIQESDEENRKKETNLNKKNLTKSQLPIIQSSISKINKNKIDKKLPLQIKNKPLLKLKFLKQNKICNSFANKKSNLFKENKEFMCCEQNVSNKVSDSSSNDFETKQTNSKTQIITKPKTSKKRKKKNRNLKNQRNKNFAIQDSDNNNKILSKNHFNFDDFVKRNLTKNYKKEDLIICNTELGMWPGIITKVLNSNEVMYKIFPSENHMDEMKMDVSHLVPFPENYLDGLIAEYSTSTGLLKALQSVKRYLEQNNKLNKDKELSKGFKKLNKKKKKETQFLKSNNLTKNMLLNNQIAFSKAFKNNDQNVQLMKNNCEGTTNTNLTLSDSTKFEKYEMIYQNQSLNKILTCETETNRKRSAKTIDDEVNSNETKKLDENNVFYNLNTKKLRLLELQNEESENTNTCEIDNNNFKKKRGKKDNNNQSSTDSTKSFLSILLSQETKNYITKICKTEITTRRSQIYRRPTSSKDFVLIFRNGNLLTIEELETALTEFQFWIKLCPHLQNMSKAIEYHYIANVILPEACIFSLSQISDCSLEQAEKKYEKLLFDEQKDLVSDSNNFINEKSENGNICSSSNISELGVNKTSKNLLTSSTTPAAFHNLLLAATIMQDKEKISVANSEINS